MLPTVAMPMFSALMRPVAPLPLQTLLLGALLSLAPWVEGDSVPGLHQDFQNVHHLQISIEPTVTVHISPEEHHNHKGSVGLSSVEKKEKKLDHTTMTTAFWRLRNDAIATIVLHKDTTTTEESTTPEGSQKVKSASVPLDATPSILEEPEVSILPQKEKIHIGTSPAIIMASGNIPMDTSPRKPHNDASATITLHMDTPATTENKSPEAAQHVTSASVAIYSSSPEKPVPAVVKSKTIAVVKGNHFDQLTSVASVSPVKSLNDVKKLHLKKLKLISQPQSNEGKPMDVLEHKSSRAEIVDLINALITIIRNAPAAIKEDPDIHSKTEKAEVYLKDALELVVNAESKSPKAIKQKRDKVAEVIASLSPPASTLPVTIQVKGSTSDSVALKLAKVQEDLEKLKWLVKVLDRFAPQLASYVQNSPNKKAAEDVVDKVVAVFKAIKSVFCGNPNGRRQQVLKMLIQKEKQLVKQAMRVS